MGPDWIRFSQAFEAFDASTRAKLSHLNVIKLPAGKVLFRPGDEVAGFVLVIGGRVDVYLTGPTGREILLYSITPGETCVQTTLGLMGEEDYSAEAVAETGVEIVIVPKPMFLDLLAESQSFRTFVFHAFASRLKSIMHVLEQVAFINVEKRLASALLERAGDAGMVKNTHQELAIAIGSAREVVSRRLELFSKRGLVTLDRGSIRIINTPGLVQLIE